MSIRAPNHTQTPNEVFALMPSIKDAELRVTLAIVRATFGWQQGNMAVELSLSELMESTGLSRQGVLNGLNAGQARGTIYKIKGTGAEKSAYGLVVHEVDQSTKLTSQRSRPKVVNGVDQRRQPSRPRVVNSVDHQTPAPGAPSAEESDPERKGKKVEIQERKTLAADAAVSAPGTGQEDQTTPKNPENGDHVPAQVDSLASGEPRANTSPEKVPPGGTTPPRRLSDTARIIAAWNEHRGSLPEVQGLNEGRKKAIRKLLRDCGGNVEQAAQLVTDATREVARDDYWQQHRYGFDNLVPGKVFGRAEAWRSRQRSGPAPVTHDHNRLNPFAVKAAETNGDDPW